MRRLVLMIPLLSAACVPRINDITTTPDDPPKFRSLPEYPSSNAPLQKQAYPDLAPIAMPSEPSDAFKSVVAAAKRMPRWTIVYEDAASRVLEAVAITGLLRFRDDIVIVVKPSGGGSAVHMRSKSRLGKSDLGANAARIRAFAAELKK